MARKTVKGRAQSTKGTKAIKQRIPFPTGFVDKREQWFPLAPHPHMPAAYDLNDVLAVKRMAEGKADPHEQQAFLRWLIYATGCDANPYVPGDTHATAYASGKQWIGQQIVTLLKVNPQVLTASA